MLSRAALIALLAVVVAASGCGRKGPLEAPPGAAVTTSDDGTTAPDSTKPQKKFFLDPLLK